MAIDPGLRRLVLRTLLPAFPGLTAPEWALRLAADGIAGFILFYYNLGEPAQVTTLTGQLRQARPDLLLALDEEGGDVTRLGHRDGSPYPGNAALGRIGDPALTERVYREIGLDLRAAGFTLDLAPSLDVNTSDDNPVIGTRSFGADPAAVCAQAAAAVSGLQSAGVAACAKHFPGHGSTNVDSHLSLPTVDVPLSVLRERDLAPFLAAIKAGTQAVMTAHIRVPALTGNLPATFSIRALGELLRGELGFDGTIVTDALDMRGASAMAGGTAKAAPRALAAGADLMCIGGHVGQELTEETISEIMIAVGEGWLPVSRLEDAAERVAALTAWVSATAGTDRPGAGQDIGYPAARRAVHVEGSLPDLGSPLLVQLESEINIAVGRVPWGLGRHAPGLEELHVAPAGVRVEEIAARAGGRPVVLVARDLHRLPGAPELAEALAARLPVVVVEMGWPSVWRPAGAAAFVTTYGASRANGWAAAHALGLTP